MEISPISYCLKLIDAKLTPSPKEHQKRQKKTIARLIDIHPVLGIRIYHGYIIVYIMGIRYTVYHSYLLEHIPINHHLC